MSTTSRPRADAPASSEEEAFWVFELNFLRYRELAPALQDASDVRTRIHELLRALPGSAEVKRSLAARPDRAKAERELLLLSAYIEGMKLAALLDVAQTQLDRGAFERCRDDGRWGRLALATLIFAKQRELLLDLTLLDRWHSRRRAVMEIVGRVPRLRGALGVDEVQAALIPAMEATVASRRLTPLRVMSRGEGDVLVGFRRTGAPGSLRDADGGLVTGFTEELVLLRFRDLARRVDVSADAPDAIVPLAEAIGSALLGAEIRYRRRRHPVTARALAELLRLLCDPDFDALRLVEIKAELPGEAGRPVKTLRGGDGERIEATVQREAEFSNFARDWRTVHHAKVWFEGYRFTLHFPHADEELVLTYADLERDTGVSERFEVAIEALRDQLGADIRVVPRVRGATRSRRARAEPPRVLQVEHWRRLLAPVLDEPEDWEAKILARLRDEGLLRWEERWFFRCGDPCIDRERAGVHDATLDCCGEIEWRNPARPRDPFFELANRELSCPECGVAWRVPACMPPVRLRLRISVQDDAAWVRVRALQPKEISPLEEEIPGLASGLLRSRRFYAAWLPLVSPSEAIGRAGGQPIAWFSIVGDPRLSIIATRGADLAEVMSGGAGWTRALLAALSGNDAALAQLRAQHPLPARTVRKQAQSALGAPPELGSLALVQGKVMFYAFASGAALKAGLPWGTWVVLAPQASAARRLLVTLARAAQLDDERGGGRRFRDLAALSLLDDILKREAKPSAFYLWIKRLRDALDAIAPGLGAVVIEDGSAGSRAGKGYRLGLRYDCAGLVETAKPKTE